MEHIRGGRKIVVNPQTGTVIKPGTPFTRALNKLLAVAFTIALLAAFSIVGLSAVFLVNDVQGNSMVKTLNAHHYNSEADQYHYDQVVVNKLKQPEPGDIFVIKNYSKGTLEYHIKRLIAVGGDTVCLVPDNGRYYVYVNGEPLDEPYLDENHWGHMVQGSYKYETFRAMQDGSMPYGTQVNIPGYEWEKWFENGELHVPQGYVFYMGDNRRTSGDSISYGPQPASYIVGTVIETIRYPEDFFSHYWKLFIKWLGF